MNQIKQYTGDGPVDLAGGLRDAPADDPKWLLQKNQVIYDHPTKWKKNMMLSNAPERDDVGSTVIPPPAAGIDLTGDDFGGATGTEIVVSEAADPAPTGRRVDSRSAGVGAGR